MSVITNLRKLGDFDGVSSFYSERDERLEEIEVLEYRFGRPEGVQVKEVHSSFEDLGRWSNYETTVYEVKEGNDIAYFEYGREVPATESQEGMDCSFHFQEVVPKEVTIVKYVVKAGGKS